MLKLITQTFSLLLFVFSAFALGESAEERGLAIAVEADRQDVGWQDSSTDLRMTLRNQHGDDSVRLLSIKTLEVADDGDKSLTLFREPKDVRGTALLTFSHRLGPDDQWLYLPALKRVKRIASHNKSGPFMGSEFAFEDLSSQEVEKYSYQYLRDDPCEPWTCFVVARVPKDENSGYTRQITWIDQEAYRLQKVEFYDRKNTLLKTLTTKGYQLYLGQYWRPDTSSMVNHQSGKSTQLEWSNYQFRTGLTDSDFTENALKRAR